MIELKNVNKYYLHENDKLHALKDINLKIAKNDIFGCIGFSGAGKSTLLRCVNGLESISSGQILINGVDIQGLGNKEKRKIQKEIGIIFQQFNLLNQKTVYDNIKVVLEISNYPKDEIDLRIKEVLSFVELEDKHLAYPSQLSGGQKQRVGIARAIANKPKILLCDEPTSALDPITTTTILDLIKKVNVELGITILLITHEMEVISKICNHVAIMQSGEIIEHGDSYNIFVNPKHQVTKRLVNSVIHNELPNIVRSQIVNNQRDIVCQIIYNADEISQPLISKLSRELNVEISILFGSIIEFQDKLLGNLVVGFNCDNKKLAKIYTELNKYQLIVREVEEWNSSPN